MAFDIGIFAQQLREQPLDAPAGIRDIETVTGEILRLKEDAGRAIIGIGRRLIEAKELLPHGEWLPWLTERVEFSERTAQNFMRLAREWSNPQTLADLGASKALALLALPPEEREQFLAESHVVDGEEKAVIDMSARELDKALRERDEARLAAEKAQAEAADAEASRAKMEADMAALKRLHESAQAEAAQAGEQARKAMEELQALREKPVDVAVMAVDQEALDRARAEAVVQVQAKLDKAVEARKKAEEKRKAAEDAVEAAKAAAAAEVRKQLEQTEAELQEARRQLEAAARAERQAMLNGDQELAAFNVIFGEVQEQVNKLHGLLLKVRGRGDETMADKLCKALQALADAVRRCAE